MDDLVHSVQNRIKGVPVGMLNEASYTYIEPHELEVEDDRDCCGSLGLELVPSRSASNCRKYSRR